MEKPHLSRDGRKTSRVGEAISRGGQTISRGDRKISRGMFEKFVSAVKTLVAAIEN